MPINTCWVLACRAHRNGDYIYASRPWLSELKPHQHTVRLDDLFERGFRTRWFHPYPTVDTELCDTYHHHFQTNQNEQHGGQSISGIRFFMAKRRSRKTFIKTLPLLSLFFITSVRITQTPTRVSCATGLPGVLSSPFNGVKSNRRVCVLSNAETGKCYTLPPQNLSAISGTDRLKPRERYPPYQWWGISSNIV